MSSKISVIEAMLNKVDKLVLGGGMVFTFLKVSGSSRATSRSLFFCTGMHTGCKSAYEDQMSGVMLVNVCHLSMDSLRFDSHAFPPMDRHVASILALPWSRMISWNSLAGSRK